MQYMINDISITALNLLRGNFMQILKLLPTMLCNFALYSGQVMLVKFGFERTNHSGTHNLQPNNSLKRYYMQFHTKFFSNTNIYIHI